MSRNARGEGSIYRRKDGRWAGSVFVDTTAGTRKRVHVYRKTRAEAHDALSELIRRERRGVPTPARTWTIGAYIEYWLTDVVGEKNRPNTIDNYRGLARNHLADLAQIPLPKSDRAAPPAALQHHGDQRDRGTDRRSSQVPAACCALPRRTRRTGAAQRRQLVQITASQPRPVTPWDSEETNRFLEAAKSHRWYAAFVLVLRVGLRRGEVLGLSWDDLDRTRNLITLERQAQRIRGSLQPGSAQDRGVSAKHRSRRLRRRRLGRCAALPA
ncbi:hypothetical protein G5V59_13045 [Nocardioides sp. W3-2-3]|uniref:hypothetical protein n=1 Tax=Nocardioides convexus TaxID=2712224 RepID=UPI002418ABDF|nr:hypothetical protein [Nocardioides convexus]NHA00638.1 hypothetical protein [Nocardioides convexus]